MTPPPKERLDELRKKAVVDFLIKMGFDIVPVSYSGFRACGKTAMREDETENTIIYELVCFPLSSSGEFLYLWKPESFEPRVREYLEMRVQTLNTNLRKVLKRKGLFFP